MASRTRAKDSRKKAQDRNKKTMQDHIAGAGAGGKGVVANGKTLDQAIAEVAPDGVVVVAPPGPAIETQEPVVETQEPPVETPGAPAVNGDSDAARELDELLVGGDEQDLRIAAEAVRNRRAQDAAARQAAREQEAREQEELEKFRAKRMWPEKKSLPQFYTERKPQPCPNCRRTHADNLSRAVVLASKRDKVAWFRCKLCGHRWKLPIRQEKL